MIGRMALYPYGNVRARALSTRLLSSSELLDLAETDSRAQATGDLARRLRLSEGHSSIDHRLQSDYLYFGQVILRAIPEPLKPLFRAYLHKPWLENLLLLCRKAFGEGEHAHRPVPLLRLPDTPDLPDPDHVETLEDVRVALSDGPYRDTLSDHLENAEEQNLPLVEGRLVLAYWKALYLRVARLSPVDRAPAAEILGMRADLDALRILWRGIEQGMASDEIHDLLPPLADLLTSERLRCVLRSENRKESLLRMLQRSVPGRVGEGEYETFLRRRLRRHLRRRLRDAPFGVAVPLSALLLKELEVVDLQGLLGGLRFGLDRAALESFLAAGKG